MLSGALQTRAERSEESAPSHWLRSALLKHTGEAEWLVSGRLRDSEQFQLFQNVSSHPWWHHSAHTADGARGRGKEAMKGSTGSQQQEWAGKRGLQLFYTFITGYLSSRRWQVVEPLKLHRSALQSSPQ